MKKVNKLTLTMFNTVLQTEEKPNTNLSILNNLGLIVTPKANYAIEEIIEHYETLKLSGEYLNKTFHKSWKVIENSPRYELMLQQILHYITGYGTNFEEQLYIPNEILELPDKIDLNYKIIDTSTNKEIIDKCLNLLQSGIAMKLSTIENVVELLGELGYGFTGAESIKNKEALILIADNYGIYPEKPVEFLRYVIFKTTGQTLLIKNDYMFGMIKDSSFDPSRLFEQYGLTKLSVIFNRFKPIFLAYKSKSKHCAYVVNKLSKLSKSNHKPMNENLLNLFTQRYYSSIEVESIVEHSTIFAIFKALSLGYNIMTGQDVFIYSIRNGKSFVEEKQYNAKSRLIINANFHNLLNVLKNKFNFSGRKVFIPENIQYGLPTSEKMFVGNIPVGTKFIGDKLAIGIYWENAWGASDLDLSAINIAGKVGWNADYKQESDIYYSGDITNAPNGAVEYIYANSCLTDPSLINYNVYTGDENCKFKVIIGDADGINENYMMNPNNLIVDEFAKSNQKQNILGIILPNKFTKKQEFVLINVGSGCVSVSSDNKITELATKALYQQYESTLSFNLMIDHLGCERVSDKNDSDYDFSLSNLTKNSFIEFFSKK